MIMKNSAEPAASLTRVLSESERVEDLVEECAQELSIVNDTLKQELESATPPPDIENALVQSEAVEDKVQQVAEKLSAVNQALHGEVEERHVLEKELAAI